MLAKKIANKVGSLDNFFKWVKGTNLIELDSIDITEDPVRPELSLKFRKSYDRKIYLYKINI